MIDLGLGERINGNETVIKSDIFEDDLLLHMQLRQSKIMCMHCMIVCVSIIEQGHTSVYESSGGEVALQQKVTVKV